MAPVNITMSAVRQHNKPTDLWVVIENKVYNLSKFQEKHPGGKEPLAGVAGTDATKDFNDVGHSSEARKMMTEYYVGDLTSNDGEKKS